MFHCECGSVIQKSSLRTHLKTKKHQKLLEKMNKTTTECVICMESHTTTPFTCKTCYNTHCITCHEKIDRCPFCRATFMEYEMLEYLFFEKVAPALKMMSFFTELGILKYYPWLRDDLHYVKQTYQQMQPVYKKFPEMLQYYRIIVSETNSF